MIDDISNYCTYESFKYQNNNIHTYNEINTDQIL